MGPFQSFRTFEILYPGLGNELNRSESELQTFGGNIPVEVFWGSYFPTRVYW